MSLLITAGYSLAGGLTFGHEFSRLLRVYPGMITATIGTAIMVLVVLTSLVIVRRRMRYESWYFVHFTVYAGIALGYLHQLPTGNEFVVHPVQADYWISLYVATLAILLAYRVVGPIRSAIEAQTAGEARHGRGAGRDEHRGYRAGSPQRSRHRRASSCCGGSSRRAAGGSRIRSRSPRSPPMIRCGSPSRPSATSLAAIGELEPGTRVFAEGPFGVFTSEARRRREVVLIAGGIGITPLRALFEELSESADVTLLYRVISHERSQSSKRSSRELERRTGRDTSPAGR